MNSMQTVGMRIVLLGLGIALFAAAQIGAQQQADRSHSNPKAISSAAAQKVVTQDDTGAKPHLEPAVHRNSAAVRQHLDDGQASEESAAVGSSSAPKQRATSRTKPAKRDPIIFGECPYYCIG
jgi:hypothetical protein